jgi:hypothetical protein
MSEGSGPDPLWVMAFAAEPVEDRVYSSHRYDLRRGAQPALARTPHG